MAIRLIGPVEFARGSPGSLREQTHSRVRRLIGASLDHACGYGWHPRAVPVFDLDFNNEAHVELPRNSWVPIDALQDRGGCPRDWPLPVTACNGAPTCR